MQTSSIYGFLAEVVLLTHFAIVLFVVGGLVLIVLGNKLRWSWVNGIWFRATHLASIIVVVAESWFGITCPLTILEAWLRTAAGLPAHDQSFIEHWVQRLLFYEAPTWVFVLAYTLFGLLVVAAWWHFPPEDRKGFFWNKNRKKTSQ